MVYQLSILITERMLNKLKYIYKYFNIYSFIYSLMNIHYPQ